MNTNKSYLYHFVFLSGIALGFGFSVWTLLTFLVAYFKGNFQITIFINRIGEAKLEIFIIPIATIWTLTSCILYIVNLSKQPSK